MADEKRDPPRLTREVLLPPDTVDIHMIRRARRQTNHQFIRWKRLPGKGWFRGVCAGLAYRFGMRPWKVRLAFVLGSLMFAFLPAISYLLYATFVPVRRRTPRDFEVRTRSKRKFSLDPG